MKRAETLSIPDKEAEKADIYETLLDLNTLIAKAIQGKIHTLFPLRKTTPLAFAEEIRDNMTAIDEPHDQKRTGGVSDPGVPDGK